MERAKERRPVTGYGISVQLAFGVDYLIRGAQVFQKLVAQFHSDFGKGAFAAHKLAEVQDRLLIA